ncbi:MAG: hypothetical protein GQ549_00540, partial [Gammaproteobacteria bacterium]|nr:hypothetical protein [Gammaproteobacteria bacterium]
GTFHEDFHVKDDFIDSSNSWTGVREQFNFPAPGEDFPDKVPEVLDASGNPLKEDPQTASDAVVNPDGIRGVSEDKRWGDQMFYAYGRSFSWCAGKQMGAGGAFGTFNYGNGYTENLITETGGTSEHPDFPLQKTVLKDQIVFNAVNGWSPNDDVFGSCSGWPGFAATAIGWVNGKIKWAFDYPQNIIHTRHLPTDELRDARRLFPGDTAVEKTFGNTYTYQAGLAVDIHEGHSISRSYGDSEESVTGDANSVVHGDSYSTKVGDNSEFTLGNSSANYGGNKLEMMMGSDTEIKLAADTEIKLSIDTTIQVGFDIGFQYAGFLKYTGGAGIDRTAARISSDDVELKSMKVFIKDEKVKLENGKAVVSKVKLRLAQAAVFIFA